MADTPIGEVILKDVRLSFAELFKPGKPQKNDDGEMVPGKYKANLLMTKGTDGTKANMAKLKKAAEQVKEEKWGKSEKWPKLKDDRVFLRDGDKEDWDGYEGSFYVSANNQNQPVLVDRKKDANGKWIELRLQNGGSKLLYSGAYVNAIVRIWAQDNQHGKRLNASIESVQFLRHGEAFSGGKPVDPNDKFDDIEDDDDDTIGEDDDDDTIGEDADDDSGLV
jgi:hypothetical protein